MVPWYTQHAERIYSPLYSTQVWKRTNRQIGMLLSLNNSILGTLNNGFHQHQECTPFSVLFFLSISPHFSPQGPFWVSNTLHQCRAQLHKILYLTMPISPPSFFLSGRRVKSILCAPAIACKVEWQECTQKRKRGAGGKRKGGGVPGSSKEGYSLAGRPY